MQIFVNSNYDFVKWRHRAVMISLVIIAIGVALFFTRGINLGIDFAGGANVVLKFGGPVPTEQLRSLLPAATIQQYGRPAENSALIRLPQQGREGDYAGQIVGTLHQQLNAEAAAGKHDLNYLGRDTLASFLKTNDPDKKGTNAQAGQYYDDLARRIIDKRSELGIFSNMSQVTSVPGVTSATTQLLSQKAFLGKFNVLNQETVGPQVGKELQSKAMWAIILSALAMAIYIAVRFEQGFIFGVAGLACIIHDVLVAMTFLLAMNLEFSLNVVAALLTIVGYSINDNVVMYDRVREIKRKTKTKMTLAQSLNQAINETLSRTVLTAGSVFLVLLALLIFGGEVIRGFSWILLVGVISGTFSTLFVVPAVAVWWDNRTSKRAATEPAPVRNTSSTPRVEARRRAS